MSSPIYLQDYKVKSEQGNVKYSVISALPNQTSGQYTWNFVSHMVLEKCTRLIRIKYDFQDTEFQKEITFQGTLMGTLQSGSQAYNAGDFMSYEYNKELLEMEVTILFPLEEKIFGKNLSWNIFINDCDSESPTCNPPEGCSACVINGPVLTCVCNNCIGGNAVSSVNIPTSGNYTAVNCCGDLRVAELPDLPPGNYQETCEDCYVDLCSHTLSCSCKDDSGNYVPTSIGDVNSSSNISNCDGTLTNGGC